ncbi:hypothetical protein B7P43_G13937 [Cryptotermes secundus]|uniref:Integrase p58-like C-terminal domain-containing protein n=1 Tax=Cryptotermes secundus TaxID=105785 RepID=A0A2J7Q8C7_9NEOP|nr:hypothetical protein B7P43_G13937 [Cryptotermes secundus]
MRRILHEHFHFHPYKMVVVWECHYKVVIRINDVAYRIQENPRSRMLVVHLDRLAPYHGAARDEQP